MTLTEMAELVCDKVGKTDPESIALCKRFIARRYHLVWGAHLWASSIGVVHVAVEAGVSQFLPVEDETVLETVMSVRLDPDTPLSPTELVDLFITNPARFEEIGSPNQFSHLSPVGVSRLVDLSAERYIARSSSAADVGKKVVINSKNGVTSSSEEIELNGTFDVETNTAFLNASSITKEETTGEVTITTKDSDITVAYLGSAITSQSFPRIRLHPTPSEDVTLLVLGKKRIDGLSHDHDSPSLPCHDVLIAHAQADMLERARQYGKAALIRQEAIVQTQKLVTQELNSQARVCLIRPVIFDPPFTFD
jgi:hypothetical protein